MARFGTKWAVSLSERSATLQKAANRGPADAESPCNLRFRELFLAIQALDFSGFSGLRTWGCRRWFLWRGPGRCRPSHAFPQKITLELREDGQHLGQCAPRGRGHVESFGERGQRLGSIDVKKQFDAVLLVLLDENFNALSIYEADRMAVFKALSAPGSRSRNERGALGVSKFKSIARLWWNRSVDNE
jgi:hypothetical protein